MWERKVIKGNGKKLKIIKSTDITGHKNIDEQVN